MFFIIIIFYYYSWAVFASTQNAKLRHSEIIASTDNYACASSNYYAWVMARNDTPVLACKINWLSLHLIMLVANSFQNPGRFYSFFLGGGGKLHAIKFSYLCPKKFWKIKKCGEKTFIVEEKSQFFIIKIYCLVFVFF